MSQAINNDIILSEQVTGLIKNAWNVQVKAVTAYFNKYDNDFYYREVAEGRNRALYLLGHLTASSDGLLPLLGLGERLHPELEALFLVTPDRQVPDKELPSLEMLKAYWEDVTSALTNHFASLTTTQWLERHTRVSPEDFALDPKRNKLNVLLSRITHMAYHVGQLNLLQQAASAGLAG